MITQFTIGFSRNLNLGNFEHARVEASVTTVVSEGDDHSVMTANAQAELLRLLQETLKCQHEDREAAGFYKKMKNV